MSAKFFKELTIRLQKQSNRSISPHYVFWNLVFCVSPPLAMAIYLHGKEKETLELEEKIKNDRIKEYQDIEDKKLNEKLKVFYTIEQIQSQLEILTEKLKKLENKEEEEIKEQPEQQELESKILFTTLEKPERIVITEKEIQNYVGGSISHRRELRKEKQIQDEIHSREQKKT